MRPSERELRQSIDSLSGGGDDYPDLPLAYALSAPDMQDDIHEVPGRPDLVNVEGAIYNYPAADLLDDDAE